MYIDYISIQCTDIIAMVFYNIYLISYVYNYVHCIKYIIYSNSKDLVIGGSALF